MMRWVVVVAVTVLGGLSVGGGRAGAFTLGETAATTGIQGTLSGNATSNVAGITKSVRAALPSSTGTLPSLGKGGGGPHASVPRPASGGGAAGWAQGGDSWARGDWGASGVGSWAAGGTWATSGTWATPGGR
jgi:hypothetical protein